MKMKQRKDGRYEVRVYLGTVNKKPQYKSVYGKTTKEVKEKVKELRKKYDEGLNLTNYKDSLGEVKSKWFAMKKSLLTEQQYKNNVALYKPFNHLSDIPISQVQTADLQTVINEYSQKNPNTHKPTSKKTLKNYKSLISQIFEFAIENRIVNYNPAKYIKIPQNAPQQKRRALTTTEQQRIVEMKHRAQLPAMIMLFAGVRLGELLALQWCDIDLKKSTITVNKVLNQKQSPPVIVHHTKTEAGMRTINIPQILVDYLRPLKNQHSAFDYVNVNTAGKLFNKSSWSELWKSYMLDINIKYGGFTEKINKYRPEKIPMLIQRFTAHELRHTCATNLFYAGYDPKYVQTQMGHADSKITYDIYTHYLQTQESKEAVKVFDDYIKNNICSSKCSSDI